MTEIIPIRQHEWPTDTTPNLVSILVTAYNHEKFIVEAIEGILMQKTNFRVEILINDDCSTDNTAALIKEYETKYPNLFIPFYQSENQYSKGKKPWINVLFPAARGKYIAICEGDDYWIDENKLQKQVDILETNPDCSICFHSAYVIQEGMETSVSNDNLMSTNGTFTINDLARGNFIHTPTVMYRNIVFSKLPEWYKDSPVGDYVLHVLQSKYGIIKFIPEPMAVYRRHINGRWSNLSHRNQKITLIKTVDFLLKEDFNEEVIFLLKEQKLNYIKNIIANSFQTDWTQFISDLENCELLDESISKYLLSKEFQNKENNIGDSRTLKWGKRVVKILNFFGI